VRPASAETERLFEPSLVEAAFQVTEHAFNAARLRAVMGRRLADSGVEVRFGEAARRAAATYQPGEIGGRDPSWSAWEMRIVSSP